MGTREFVQVLGPDLFLALEEDPYRERQRANGRLVRLDRLQPGHKVALVVGGATAVQEPVAHGRFERRRRPFVERVGRLDVVVVVHQERPRAGTLLADDRRRPSDHALGGRVEAGADRALEHRARRLVDPALLGGHGREADERAQLVEKFLPARAHVRIEGGEGIRHGPDHSPNPERS